jgi:hypothetical protein
MTTLANKAFEKYLALRVKTLKANVGLRDMIDLLAHIFAVGYGIALPILFFQKER